MHQVDIFTLFVNYLFVNFVGISGLSKPKSGLNCSNLVPFYRVVRASLTNGSLLLFDCALRKAVSFTGLPLIDKQCLCLTLILLRCCPWLRGLCFGFPVPFDLGSQLLKDCSHWNHPHPAIDDNCRLVEEFDRTVHDHGDVILAMSRYPNLAFLRTGLLADSMRLQGVDIPPIFASRLCNVSLIGFFSPELR